MPRKARIFFPEEKLQKEAGRVFGMFAEFVLSTKYMLHVNTFAAKQFGTTMFSQKSDERGSTKIVILTIPMHER